MMSCPLLESGKFSLVLSNFFGKFKMEKEGKLNRPNCISSLYLRYFKHLYEMYIAKELLFPVKLALKTGRKNLTLYGLVRPLQISYTSCTLRAGNIYGQIL